MMFPSNASLTVAEAVPIFHGVHAVYNVMGNHGLQFQHESPEDVHFMRWHESGLLQSPNMAGDRRKVVIHGGQTVINPELSSNMVPSHCSSNTGMVVRAAFVRKHGRSPLSLYQRISGALRVIGGATKNRPVPKSASRHRNDLPRLMRNTKWTPILAALICRKS